MVRNTLQQQKYINKQIKEGDAGYDWAKQDTHALKTQSCLRKWNHYTQYLNSCAVYAQELGLLGINKDIFPFQGITDGKHFI